MQPSRPKNLNLFTIRFPIPAIVSILHRASGFVLVLLIPALLWLLQYSLTPEGYQDLQFRLGEPSVQFFFWLVLIPLCFHLVAGIRHLLADINLEDKLKDTKFIAKLSRLTSLNIQDSLKKGRISAYFTFIVFGLLIILTGIWLW